MTHQPGMIFVHSYNDIQQFPLPFFGSLRRTDKGPNLILVLSESRTYGGFSSFSPRGVLKVCKPSILLSEEVFLHSK